MQVRMEYVIMRNLDAAIKNLPKPGSFAPTAGNLPLIDVGLVLCMAHECS